MAKRVTKKVDNRPLLIKVGSHLIDPVDVACISRIKSKRLCIVRLKSQPNMEYPIWVNLDDIDVLLRYFRIERDDIPEDDNDVEQFDVVRFP